MDAHFKNVEKSSQTGKFDPFAGLATSGIAGTGTDKDKEEEEQKPLASSSTSEIQSKEGLFSFNIYRIDLKTLLYYVQQLT